MDCIVVCGNAVLLFFRLLSVGLKGEMLCCVVVGIFSTNSSIMKFDGF